MSYPCSKDVREGGQRVWIADMMQVTHFQWSQPCLELRTASLRHPGDTAREGQPMALWLFFLWPGPALIPQQTEGNTRTTGRSRGSGRAHGSPGLQLPGGADSSTPACLAASTLLWRTLASWFWSILNRLMLTLLYTFVHWLRMNNVNTLVISVLFVLSINAVVTIRLSLLWLNHCYCFHVDYLKNNKIFIFLVILYWKFRTACHMIQL